MSHLELTGLSKSFGTTKVLNDVSLSVRNGEFLTLVGASGCGKSTILRVIAGLEPQDSGTVQIGGRVWLGEGRVGAAPDGAILKSYLFATVAGGRT